MSFHQDIVGIDIGGTKCAVSYLCRESSSVEEVYRFETTTLEETLGRLVEGVKGLKLGEAPVIGISCGGPLDSGRGLILSPPNLPGWDRVEIVKLFEEKFGGRAFLMNDANASALAEWKFGAGRGCENMVFLTCGTGMGAGLVLNGRLYEGTTGAAGEVGHMRLADAGPVGFGKAGSFEGFCSGGGIARLAELRLAEAGAARPDWAAGGFTAKCVADAARAGNGFAGKVIAESARRMGDGIAIIVDLFNPQRVVVGGIYPRCKDLLEGELMGRLREEGLKESVEACVVVPAELGETIGSHAAVAVALHHLENSMGKG